MNRINLGAVYSTIFANYYFPFLRDLDPQDVVLDGGANIGAFSLLIHNKVRKVIAIEPNPTNFSYLKKNISLSGASNVIPINAALSSENGDAYISGEGETGHLSQLRGFPIKTITLDSIEDEVGLSISRAKLDIEGAEPLVISRDLRMLRHVNGIIFELDQKQLEKIKDSILIPDRLPSYKSLISTLEDSGFDLSFYVADNIAAGLFLTNLFQRKRLLSDVIRAEIASNFFGLHSLSSGILNRLKDKKLREYFLVTKGLLMRRESSAYGGADFRFGLVYGKRE